MSHYKRIENSREARLWIGQVFTPIVGVVLASSPEARKVVVDGFTKVKDKIKSKVTKTKE